MGKFLIVSQVFPPDPAAVGQYFEDAAQALAEGGDEVTVLTANRGYDDPGQHFEARETRGGVTVRRLPASSFGKSNLVLRILGQLSFLLQSIVRGLSSRGLTDLLVSTSPPMAAFIAVVVGACRPKVKVHYWVMDLNPDQAVALGVFGPRHPLVLAMNWLNRRILKRADSIIALDRCMLERLEAKLRGALGRRPGAVAVLPPWPMETFLEPVAHADNSFRQEQGWAARFVVMYSGNHSWVHPLDTVLEAAGKLEDDPRFVFVFIGGGKGKAVVDAWIEKRGKAGNVVSLPYQDLSAVRYSLSAADLHLVSLGDAMSGIVHPCKIYGALGIGRPVLCLGPKGSYLDEILADKDCGRTIRHGDVNGMERALQNAAAQSPEAWSNQCARARQRIAQHYSRESLRGQFLQLLRRN